MSPELVHEIFALQAAETPEALAVAGRGLRLSYRELDLRATRLARRLAALGVGPEVPVAVLAGRSPEAVVAVLAVLKAGGCYLPLDPAYPEERLAWILADSGASVLLTRGPVPAGASVHTLLLGEDVPEAEDAPELPRAGLENLAYVIYTSGSTGRPKGVEVPHRGLANLAAWHRRAYGITPASRATRLAGSGFDASVWEVWPYLAAGASLHIPEEGIVLSPDRLVEWLVREEITHTFLPTPLAEAALAEPWPEDAPLEAILTGGDRLHRRPRPDHPFGLFNHYGPTESSVVTTWGRVETAGEEMPSIGQPIDGAEVRLDESGELLIGGVGLARGYRGRPDLTAERFVPAAEGRRLYRTGDLARLLPSGEIDFIGRADFQVKIRGVRIELGEIEAVLRRHPAVREGVVLARDDGRGGRFLAGYVAADGEAPATELRAWLSRELPDVMVPAAWVFLEALPVTPNGKVDRAALPAPEFTEEAYVAPRTEAESAVAEIFAEVLRLPKAGAEDDFFALGGHSLTATQVLSRVRSRLGVDLPPRALFDHPTVAALAREMGSSLDTSGEDWEILPLPRPDVPVIELPASFAQQGLWLADRLHPGVPLFNTPFALALDGPLDTAALGCALSEIVRRHEPLRTAFREEGGRVLQRIARPAPVPLPVADLSGLSEAAREREAERLLAAEARRPFDLGRGPMLQLRLLRFGPGEHVLLTLMHHIVSDDWSLWVFLSELAALYAAFSAGRPSPLPEPAARYGDFAVWQRRWLEGGHLSRQLAWWRERLEPPLPVLDLPADRPRPAVQSGRGARLSRVLPGDLSAGLSGLGRAGDVSLFIVLLAAFDTLLSRLTTSRDVLVGSPIANRHRVEVEGLIGYFVNLLALRGDLSGDPRFGDLVARLRETVLGAYGHQDVPFGLLVEELASARDLSRSPLTAVHLVLGNAPRPPAELAPGLRLTPRELATGTVQGDLSLHLEETRDGISAVWSYATDLFDAATAARMAGAFETLLAGIVAAPAARLSDLPLLSPAERAQLLAWGENPLDVPRGLCLHEIFERRVDLDPEAPALEWVGAGPGERLTYGELDRRANRLAHHLIAQGAGPEVWVGLSLERSVAMIVGLLAVAKAGSAYVPLDPSYPADRLAYMAGETRPRVVITKESLCAEAEAIAARPESRPAVAVDPGNAAYVIFTSGSTGRPKGVVVPHAGLPNLAGALSSVFGAGPGDRMLLFAPLAFDTSVFEILTALPGGATLCIAGQDDLLPGPGLLRLLEEKRITRLTLTPSALAALPEGDLPAVVSVTVAGEACTADLVERWGRGRRFFNCYGPTEHTVWASVALCPPSPRRPTIGRPVANKRLAVVDPDGNPVPAGVAGELWVGGTGAARGYLNRPDLTAERFRPDPFAPEPGARAYRTGDLVRWLPDGNLDFLGRNDFQVKIRGFRIELEEIEAVLAAHPAVRDAVVLAVGEGPGRRLVGYVVPEPGGSPGRSELRAHLSERLPDYMVPAAWVTLDALPLTPSDKVDRQALARIAPAEAGEEGGVEPRTPVEEALAGIFADLLGVSRVGVQADFFALGGHSLLATQVLARVHRLFGVEIPVRALFERPTVEALALRIEAAAREAWGPEPPLSPRPRDGAVPLSFGQERLWIADQLGPGQPVYNIPLTLSLRGPLAVPALGEALAEIVRRHEALRTTFAAVAAMAGDPVQIVSPPGARALPLADLAGLPEGLCRAEAGRLVLEEALRPFDLSRGPLVRWMLVRLGAEEHRLLLSLHHIVADGWSVGVLLEELAVLYGAFAAGRPSPLPELPFQLPDFALWQREWLAGGVLDAQLAWWRERLGGDLPVLELPTDRPRPAAPSFRGATELLTLPADLADGLRDLSRRRGATLYMTLLAASGALLGRHAGQDDLLVGSPVANRNRAELEKLIGFFVNTVVLRGNLAGDPGFGHLVGRVREEALGAWAHQDVPFDKLVEALAPERDLSRSPLFQVSFGLEAPRPPLPLGPGLTLEALSTATGTAKFDLSLVFQEVPGGLASSAEYAADLFDAATVRRMLGRLAALLAGAVSHPEARISDLPLLPEAEREELAAWNAGLRRGRPHPEETTVRERFEAQAARTPDAPAVITEDGVLTYAELRGRALRLASRLQALGVGPEVPVGVYCDRTPGLIAAFVAVMEAGGVYVPLDPSYPAERIAFMVADARCAVVLAESALPEGIAEGVRVLPVDGPGGEESFLPPALAPQNLAYVIYTSGSTGNPKRVGVSHGAAAAQGVEAGRYYGLGPGDRFLLFVSPSFDVSVENLMGPLLSGAALVPRGAELPAPAETTRRIAGLEITVVNFAPAYWIEWVRSFEGAPARPESLRLVIVGGDEMPGEVVRLLRRTPLSDVRLLNVYGPTEAVVTATMEEVRELPAGLPPVLPVGRLIPGRSAHVLDRHGNLLPAGVPGEMALGGLLARGYLDHPALTALRFVPDPFSGEPGARLYRTGDLLRQRPGGGFEFLGRVDRQVKIRGVRVEPGEIEAALLRHPRVLGAAVGVRTLGGEKALVAWVVPREAASPVSGDLRAFLAERLPAALVPAAFVILGAFPMTPNGKVDRRALPAPEPEERTVEGLAPRTPAEELLAGVWADLLGAGRVGVDQSFFALGGHSLLATRLVSRIRVLFGVELPLRAVFEAPTVAALAARISAEERGVEAPPVLPRSPGERLPLSFGQERLWILHRLAPGTAVYNMPLAFRVRGPLSPAALARALSEVVRRHEALRTTFDRIGGEPVQVVSPPEPFPLPLADLSRLPREEREREAERLARKEALRPFDLRRGPLFRAALLKLAPEEHRLLLTMHHIVSDGWSLGLLLREISAFYEGSPGPGPAVQYPDFALWQRRWLEGGVLAAQLSWWRERLAGELPVLALPTDRPRPAIPSQRGALERLDLSAELAGRLRDLSRRQGATLYMTLLAAFDALLYRYTGQDDLLVGSPVAGRNRAEAEGTIGFFVNILVLRASLAGDPGFSPLLARVRESVLGAWAHQDVPFEQLVSQLAPDRDLSRSPLFQVSLTLESTPPPPLALGPGLAVSAEPVETGTAKFDFSAGFQEVPEGLVSLAEYATDLFDAATVRRMLGHLATLLEGIAADPAARVADLPLLSAYEREQLLVHWNRTEAEFPKDVPIHRQLEAWAAKTPDAPAVIAGNEVLTYTALNRRANRLARGLSARGVGPEVLVALDLERSPDLVVAALAVLKAGGAYVPVNPRDPAERRRFILEESGGLRLDREALAGLARGREDDLDVPVSGESLAYVIYTSGSTGRPKGVAIPHRGVSRLTAGAGYLGLGPGGRFAQLANPVFDASVLEIWTPLLSGAAVVVIPHEAVLSSAALADEFERQSVTAALLTPALFNRGIQEVPEGFSGLRRLLFGGEAADPIAVRTALAHPALASTRLVNAYGPTESTVIATVHPVDEAPAGASVPIGRPVPNTRVHVLDGEGEPVPVGVPGELCLGGEGLARGYLHRPGLTAERFVPDPFATGPGERLYRTGDLARFRPAGEIEFLGRIDHQVKVRGFRIELGEIETALAACPGVTGALVLVREDVPGDRRLVAYVTTPPGEEGGVTAASLRRAAQDRLPDYMVPSAFVFLPEFPLTPNGKVDRRALPAPERSGLADAFLPPRTPLEVEVAGIWGDVLGVDQVGLQDGFFDLGGHSLLATRVLARIEEAFGVDMPLQTLFESPTLEGFATALGQKAVESMDELKGLSEEELALLLQEESLG